MRFLFPVLATVLSLLSACSQQPVHRADLSANLFPEEKHFKNLRQLTHGGTNAEAYWSFDGKFLTFQHKGAWLTNDPSEPATVECDQIYSMRADGSDVKFISKNKGRTTCSFFYPDNSRILYSSTFARSPQCPPTPDMSKGYVWPIYDSYQIYSARPDGSDPRALEPGAPSAYNAEATVCKDGSVVFTSDRDGDLELYRGQFDHLGTLTDVKRLTQTPGYDGGAFFSNDCKRIVWRTSRPRPGAEMDDYKALLKQHLVRPGQLEIWMADADGSHAHQVTRMNAASFAPYFTPDGKRVVFASNPRDPRGRSFDIYMIHTDGTGLERVTYSNTFESFPMFSPDGKQIAFSSNRNAKEAHETNVFVGDWVETPGPALSMDDPDPANRFLALIKELSSPEMGGRGNGTPGLAKAEDLIADRFEKIGLHPFFDVFKKVKEGSRFKHVAKMRVTQKGQPDKILTSHNIVGTWGEGCGNAAPVVVGAHLDHLGFGAENSLEPTKSGLHPGADDNASGVAAVLEAARMIQQDPASKKACTIFVAFVGEEIGTGGSSRFVESLKAAHIKLKAMLNLDMVGRMENNTLIIFGSDSAKEWKPMIEAECVQRHLTCPTGGDGYGPSDQMPFYVAGVPVLHFFTGPHVDYHRTTDTADKINATGGIQTAEMVAIIAQRAASRSKRFTYQKAAPTSIFGKFGMDKKRAGSGAYLGTIPDYSAITSPNGGIEATPGQHGGIKLSGTRPGSPADQAGVKAGDAITGIGDQTGQMIGTIANLEQFMEVLNKLAPGQKVILFVNRGGKALQLPATVGKKE